MNFENQINMIIYIIKHFSIVNRYNCGMPDANQLSIETGSLLKANGLWLATAESCTGGLLGHLITNIPGSSDYYLGGFITYSNSAKEHLLGVKYSVLNSFGAVSQETVNEMANGIREAFKNEKNVDRIIGISISGIAGPGGGSMEKPVGTVWIGISSLKENNAICFHFTGDRANIKAQAAQQALKMIISLLSK
jgi:nicotinamide-nucleotide amidase